MTSSDSINYSQINSQNINISTDLEMVEQKDIENDNNNSIDNKETSQSLEVNHNQISVHNLLYGNPIDCINPKFLGKSFAFKYDLNGDPKITIGPDCKLIYFVIFLFLLRYA